MCFGKILKKLVMCEADVDINVGSLDQGSWPGNRWYFLGEYNIHVISFY